LDNRGGLLADLHRRQAIVRDYQDQPTEMEEGSR